MGKAQENSRGVTWADSRNGKLRIALGKSRVGRQEKFDWAVWALYTGSHELAPVSRSFQDETRAREYANQLWAAN